MECADEGDAIAAELAAIDLSALLVTPCALLDYTQSLDTLGGRTETWTPVAGVTKCEFAENRPGEEHREGERKVPSTAPYVIRCGLGVDLRVRDRWMIDGVAYEVLEVEDAGQWDFFITTYCAKVE